MSQYLLDTNIVSDIIRNPQGAISHAIRAVGESRICTSIVVAGELRFGACKKGSERLTAQLEAILERMTVLPLDRPVDFHYGQIRTDLETRGTIIGANDLLIAAHALAIEAILITDNEREFRRVPGLTVENWLHGAPG
jgi:tRNA(fMet)-specific endonuclease VapC